MSNSNEIDLSSSIQESPHPNHRNQPKQEQLTQHQSQQGQQTPQHTQLQNQRRQQILEHVKRDQTLLNSKSINTALLRRAFNEAERAVGKKLRNPPTTTLAPNLNAQRNRKNQQWQIPQRSTKPAPNNDEEKIELQNSFDKLTDNDDEPNNMEIELSSSLNSTTSRDGSPRRKKPKQQLPPTTRGNDIANVASQPSHTQGDENHQHRSATVIQTNRDRQRRGFKAQTSWGKRISRLRENHARRVFS